MKIGKFGYKAYQAHRHRGRALEFDEDLEMRDHELEIRARSGMSVILVLYRLKEGH